MNTTTTLESTDSSEADNIENSQKNKANLITSTTNNSDEPESKFNEFVCDLIRKQIENENKAKTEISNRNKRVVTHIYEKIDRGHSQIYDYKLRDYLLSIGYDKESTNQAISFLLDSYDGSLELDDLKSFFGNFETASWNFKADLQIKKLLNCSLMPGYLDAFVEENKLYKYEKLYDKLYKFLLNHRLPAEMINAPYLENKILVSNLRRKILIETENALYEEYSKDKNVCMDQQCISSIKTCCSHEKTQNLTDGKSVTYWQTTNAEKCENHWILINLKKNIKVTSISLCSIGSKTDDFLRSIVIEVLAGSTNKSETIVSKCDYFLTLNSEYSICNCFPNNQNITYLKILFKRTAEKNYWGKNNDQIKIKSIKLMGQKMSDQPSRETVQDASICWYFEMLSSIALIQSQLMPSLHVKILQITKNALQNMPPLSLTLDSKNTFLTPTVLDKVDSFLKSFIEVTSTSLIDKSEAILIYLSFNLARGNLKAIMNSLLLILENYDLKYDFLDLITKINEASQLSIKKTASNVNFKSLISINNTKTEKLNETEIISTTDGDVFEFTIENFKPKSSYNEVNSSFNLVFEIEKNVTLTDINLKLKLESIGIQSVIVILIYNKEKPNLDKFTQYDSLSDKEQFDKFTKDKTKTSFEAFYFHLYDNQIDILLELPVTTVSNYAIVKFIRPKENSPKSITISQVKLTGYKHNSLELYDKLKKMPKTTTGDEVNSSFVLINTVIWFCCQLAEQHKNQPNNTNDEIIKLIDLENFEINDLWKIYVKSLEMKKLKSKISSSPLFVNLKIPILILLHELVNCAEIRSNIKLSKSSHILQNLCDIIDSCDDDTNNEFTQILQVITKEIIKNGISVFIPKNEQIELFQSIIEQNSNQPMSSSSTQFNMSLKRESNRILFEAFCKEFSKNKITLIQHMTKNSNMYENCSELSEIIVFQDQLINLCFSFNQEDQDEDTENKIIRATIDLINSIQSNVLFNIRTKLSSKKLNRDCLHENFNIRNIDHFMIDYTKFLTKQSDILLESLTNTSDSPTSKTINKLKIFYCGIFYDYVLWLSELFDLMDLDTCTNIVNLLNHFYSKISYLKQKYFSDDKLFEKEKLLKTWVFNSKTKSSIFDLAIDFSYPLAKRFVIEFDPLSNLVFAETTDLTAYSFIDSSERAYILNRIDAAAWNEKMEIKSDSFIILNIRSNRDLKLNNSFFLKFNVNAYGYDQPINKPNFKDLLDSLSSLFGLQLSRSCVELTKENVENIETSQKTQSIPEKSKEENVDKSSFLLCGFQHQLSLNSSTQALIDSNDKNQIFNDMNHEFYRILFRGGLIDKNSRALPDKKLHLFLTNLSNYFTNLSSESFSTKDAELIQKFMGLYDQNYQSQEKIVQSSKTKIGGLSLNEIILRLFCAIVWQDSSISYENLFDETDTPVFNNSAMLAYKSAESTRMFIVEKQQLHKIKNSKSLHQGKNLAEILNEKILFFLEFNRVQVDLLNFELGKLENKPSNNEEMSNDNLIFPRKKGRIPKTDSPKINLIFEFVFDSNTNNLDQLEQILVKKKQNSVQIFENFHLATKHVETIINGNTDEQFIHESLLIFLSNFYSTDSNSKFTSNYHSKSSIRKSKIQFPPNLRSKMTHYLQGLFACGLENENLVQKSYLKFVKVLLDYSIGCDSLKTNKDSKNRNLRLKSFVTCLLDMDWELYDLKFFTESNLLCYLLKNTVDSLPICDYVDSNKSLPSEILEDIFDLSKDKFDQVLKFNKEDSDSDAKKSHYGVHLPSVKEVNENDDDLPKNEIFSKDENDSFDLKIFPKMYQSVFQISNSKQYETSSLIKCISSEIRTYEQYEKYIVARYMFWKYFSKLNTNFYCDSCEVVLTGFRYVCLECRDHCLCLSCFGKSIVDDKNETNNEQKSNKPMINFSSSSTHRTWHRMLVLDHYCNQCTSLIIGKRLKCRECNDFDLCLMCSKTPEYSHDGHKKEHVMDVLEPTILVARPQDVSDAQTFLYLHSQYLFTSFALKITDMFKKYSNDQFVNKLYSQVLDTSLYLSSRAGCEIEHNLKLDKESSRAIRLYSFYNQENVIGMLGCILKTFRNTKIEKLDCENLDFDYDKMSRLIYGSIDCDDKSETSLIKILNFLFVIQNKIYDYVFEDTVSIMFSGVFKSLLVTLGPDVVNSVARKHLEKNENRIIFEDTDPSKREFTLELIFCWIYDYMTANFQKWASCYLNILFYLNQIPSWKPHVENLLLNIFENISSSLDTYKPKLHSKFLFFMYAIICYQFDIAPGQWIDFKDESLYDGAGILRSTNNFKIGLTKNIYIESYNLGYYVSLMEPESRKVMNVKNQKLDTDFRKSNEKSKIQIKSNFNLTTGHVTKLIEIFKKIFQKYPDLKIEPNEDENETSSNKMLIQMYEQAHVQRKKEFFKVFKQLSVSNNLLLFSLLSLLKDFVSTLTDSDEIDMSQILDNDLIGLVSKIIFMNTNMNSNWKSIHLRQFLAGLLVYDGFSYIKEILEKDEIKECEQTPTSESESVRSKNTKIDFKTKQVKSTIQIIRRLSRPSDFGKKNPTSKDDLTFDDLKAGFCTKAVMGVCDTSSLLFSMEDMIVDYQQNENNSEEKNKSSLKLFEDCLNKLSKYDSTSGSKSDESTKLSQLIPTKQTSGEPIRAAIKLVSTASIVLSCRELLILMVNLSSRLNTNEVKTLRDEGLVFNELNCRSEYEFIQLLDVLYYSENLFNFKLFVKNFINSFRESHSAEKGAKILSKVSLIACEFMIPEFKLVKKVSWSSEGIRMNETGRYQNKTNTSETETENNFSTTPNEMIKNLNELEKMSNITNKPNDIEKLSTQDQSNLMIVFDLNHVNKSEIKPSQKPKSLKYEKFLTESKLKKFKSDYTKYCYRDDFEGSKINDDQDSDTESIDSILEVPNFKDKKKTKKRNKSNNDTITDVYDCDDDDDYDDLSETNSIESSDTLEKKKNSKNNKPTAILFQVLSKRKDSNDEYDDNDNDDDDDEDNDDDDDTGDDSSSNDSDNDTEDYNENNSDYDSSYDYTVDDWYTSVNNTGYSENDEDKYKKSNFKIGLDSLETVPFIAIKNQNILKWKFCRNEWSTESCSFKIFTAFSKNFESAFHLLDEIIVQTDCSKMALNDLWTSLINICCVQSFNKRLKVFSLLIKIIQKVYENAEPKFSINIFELKPLKNLHYTLEFSNKDDKNFSRALYELFFFAEKLAIKWSIQTEYVAKMREKEYFMGKINETSYFINLIMSSIYSANQIEDVQNDNLKNPEIKIGNADDDTDSSDTSDTSDTLENDSDDEMFINQPQSYEDQYPPQDSDEENQVNHVDDGDYYGENW